VMPAGFSCLHPPTGYSAKHQATFPILQRLFNLRLSLQNFLQKGSFPYS